MSLAPLLGYLRGQAAYCAAHGSPLYGVLCGHLADDVEAGGPVAELCSGWTGPHVSAQTVRDDVPALRLLAGLHRLVLSRQAPELAMFFPSVGGTADPSGVAPVLMAAVRTHREALRRALDQVPQTNEVGRAAPLLGGLAHVAARTGGLAVRLYEIGASGGLNLRADRLPVGPGRLIDSPLPAVCAPGYEVVERVGGDLHPVDAATTEGRLTLTSYVWADDAARLERLRAALAVADEVPVRLLTISAAALVESIELRPGMVTVLWHSVMWQYLGAAERARTLRAVAALSSAATATSPFAYLRFERGPDPGSDRAWRYEVRLSTWPGPTRVSAAGHAGHLLGTAAAHGVPVAWAGGA